MQQLMISGTRWELHTLKGIPVHVKREDLCCELPGPPYSKMRGLELFLQKQLNPDVWVGHSLTSPPPIGVQDAGAHSRSGWGTAYICNALGIECFVFYPVYKAEGTPEHHTLREYQINARDLGAHLMPLKAGRASVLYHQGRKILMEATNGTGTMLPPGLRLPETVEATAIEVIDHTPETLFAGTWIISISSGTVAAGVMMGLWYFNEDICIIAHMGSSKNIAKTRRYMCDIAGYEPTDLIFINEGHAYSDKETGFVPFPASVYYEAKAWKWLEGCIEQLQPPIVFWNIGT